MKRDSFTELEYHSYLIRLRRVQKDLGYTWRAELVRVGSGEQHNFASLEALFGYIETITRTAREADERSVNGDSNQLPD